MAALDLRTEVLDEAAASGCEAILVHHPPIFNGLDSVTDRPGAEGLILRAAELQIAVIAAHTNLDSARGGLNEMMAELLGMTDCGPLESNADDATLGLGRIGEVAETSLRGLAEIARSAFPGGQVRRVGDLDQMVTRVACCTGSGGSLIEAAAAAGADCYVTSDLKYHDADRAPGLALVDLPHGVVEGQLMRRWAERELGTRLLLDGVEVRVAEFDTNPWHA